MARRRGLGIVWLGAEHALQHPCLTNDLLRGHPREANRPVSQQVEGSIQTQVSNPSGSVEEQRWLTRLPWMRTLNSSHILFNSAELVAQFLPMTP